MNCPVAELAFQPVVGELSAVKGAVSAVTLTAEAAAAAVAAGSEFAGILFLKYGP